MGDAVRTAALRYGGIGLAVVVLIGGGLGLRRRSTATGRE